MLRNRFITALGLGAVVLGTQLIPHPPGFSAVTSIALLSTHFLGGYRAALTAMFAIMLMNDAIFGFHSSMPFVYLCIALFALIGGKWRNRITLRSLPIFSAINAFLFFVMTNFGVWATTSFYPHTLSGLGLCYLAAVPFIANQFAGDLLFGLFFYSLYRISFKNGFSLVVQPRSHY